MGRVLILIAAAAGWACGGDEGAVATRGDLAVSNPYMPEPAIGDAAAVYFTVTNTGTEPDTLVAVSAPAARDGGLHDVVREDGIVLMTPLDGIAIGPGETVHLAPGGRHAMLMGLDRVPRHGDEVSVIVTFHRVGTDTLAVPVIPYAELEERAAPASRGAEDDHGGHAP